MNLTKEYQNQLQWRDWSSALNQCPIEKGQKVLDLGCGPGDASKLLAERGALVTGIDGNLDLIHAAKKSKIEGSHFINSDLLNFSLPKKSFDGLWSSFTMAYFPKQEQVLKFWLQFLKPGAWVCITEMHDLFGHEPLEEKWRSKIRLFYQEAFNSNRYDFESGIKVASTLKSLGLSQIQSFELSDRELSKNGALPFDVLQAWSLRLARMKRLQEFFGAEWSHFREDFLNLLKSECHRSHCKVTSVIGRV